MALSEEEMSWAAKVSVAEKNGHGLWGAIRCDHELYSN